MSDPIYQGNAVRTRCVFRDIEGELLDPATVSLKVRFPDDTETTYDYPGDGIARESEGAFEFWIATIDQAGTYVARWIGIDGDGNEIASEEEFEVEASAFTDP